MSDIIRKYLFKLSQSCDNAARALEIIKNAPNKAFEEDIDERIRAADAYIKHMYEVKRYLLYFKNQRRSKLPDVL